ncbi:hypothetical protein SDC9_90307 [bioreactor metagenome]|uniref:HPr kinase/phosphorylase C-terminal domain-containing protein n=1 Tax=bioreactor metagenome TaxID=1076179 RepID=A0A644ZRP2_9ZZZZ
MAVRQNKYSVFGLVIESELALPELLPGAGEADVRIVCGKVPAALAKPAVRTPWYEVATGQYLLKVDGIACYHVADGSVITIEPHPAAQTEDIRVFLFSSVFAALLQQREYLVLHGSAVVIAGKGVVLAGHSGSGKTAIALALYDRDCHFITDEFCAISKQNGKKVVYPGLPELHVWQDTLDKENREVSAYQPIRRGLKKYAVPIDDRFCAEAVELSNIVLLTHHKRDKVDWRLIEGGAKFEILLHNSYQPDVAKTMADKARQFQLYTAVATTNISQLTFNEQPYKAGEIANFLLKEVDR